MVDRTTNSLGADRDSKSSGCSAGVSSRARRRADPFRLFPHPNPVRDANRNYSFSSMRNIAILRGEVPLLFRLRKTGHPHHRRTDKEFRPEQATISPTRSPDTGRISIHWKGRRDPARYPGATRTSAFTAEVDGERPPDRRGVGEIGFTLIPPSADDVVRARICTDFLGAIDIDLVFAPDGIESYDTAARNLFA